MNPLSAGAVFVGRKGAGLGVISHREEKYLIEYLISVERKSSLKLSRPIGIFTNQELLMH